MHSVTVPPWSKAVLSRETKTALVVDDESSDLDALAEAVTAAGYRVITASDGNTAMQLFQAQPEAIDLLVTDIAMAPMNGCDLAKVLVKQKPSLRVIFVSGYIGAIGFQYENPSVLQFGFLRKPFAQGELAAQIRQTLEEIATRTAA